MNRFLLLLTTALVGHGCAARPERNIPASAPVGVSIAVAESASLPSSFDAGGLVRARTTAAIASRIMAPILEVRAQPGDRVRRGSPLVTLDGREMAANRSRATATVASAAEAARAAESDVGGSEAAVALARVTHDRIRILYDKRSATSQELDQAVSALDAAQAQLGGARARFAAATAAREAAQSAGEASEVAASYTVLVAPFDGLIIERSVDPGAMATPGMPLLTIEDAAAFRLEVALDEARITRVTMGQNVDVEIGASGDSNHMTITGRVSEIARLDPTSHSFLVKVDLPDASSLRSGIYGRARFAGSPRPAIVVPAAAAVRRGQLTFVYTVDGDNRARLQPVSPGTETGGRLEILAGIREGERVITSPPAALSDGARVSGVRP